MSTGRDLSDGSFLAVRLPDLCSYNRAYRPGEPGPETRQDAWRSRGPIPVFPLMVWSDKRYRPERTEVFVAAAYYRSREARITLPVATVEFMPVGFAPKNAPAVLEQANVIEDDNLNVHENGDPPALAMMSAQAALPMSDPTIRPQVIAALAPVSSQAGVTGRYLAFSQKPYAYAEEGFNAEPVYLSWPAVRDCLDGFLAGRPDSPALASDASDDPTFKTRQASSISVQRTRRAQVCRALLGDVIPFVWTGSALVSSKVRGVLIFSRTSPLWRGAPITLQGAQVANFSILKDRISGQWYKLDEWHSTARDPDNGE